MGMRCFLCVVLVAVSSVAQESSIRLVKVAEGFARPIDIQQPDDGSGRLFVVEQAGLIRVVRDGSVQAEPFLDIRDRVTRIGGVGDERGLLGMAFPPDYARKQYFYLNYTDRSSDTVISRFRVSAASGDRAEPGSEHTLLTVDQPFNNHNGGQLAFGPDGYLYIGLGDGGSAGDPQGNGQNRRALLGKMLRIDVEPDLGRYRVPASNPFAADPSYLPEIWALGLRNPWRFAFDPATGDLWVADVGQNRAEEINFQPASSRGGENYGWALMEGFQCRVSGCNTDGLVLPVYEYDTRRQGDVSVTGGYVYRGNLSPGLRGAYLYGDYASGRIWALRREGARFVNELLLDAPFSVPTFGQDRAGEVYVADYAAGVVHRIEGRREPAFTASGVVNAASFARGLVAGSLATVFASGLRDSEGITAAGRLPLPLSLGGVSVTVNGRAAPLHAVARVRGQEQVNFQAPFEVAGSSAVSVVVQRDGVSSPAVEVPLMPAQPGVFTTDGAAAIAVRNQDNTLVSPERPLSAGEDFYIYVAGLGEVDNNPGTGNAGPVNPLARSRIIPELTLGGVPCEVQFAGLAPGFAGVYQVNARVPAGIRPGNAELALQAGAAASPVVVVPVR